jgi:hypothetical protein
MKPKLREEEIKDLLKQINSELFIMAFLIFLGVILGIVAYLIWLKK